jgi:hypothetical protein
MDTISIWHWIIVLLAVLIPGIPIARILGRLGFSRWWVITAFVPIIQLIGLWVLAYARWPIENRRT